ncbi:hypothetical protein ACSBL2_03490 [Pedobacter sp. AW31-3R]|uniref:hypothetical protein n=1 Tax=Pedobacter sp. AW31-3R TaxID=3445781 RepID=UPI003F9F6DF1
MDSKQQPRLRYTEDFRIACKLNGITCDELVQYFINKASFYAFNGGDMDTAGMMATQIIAECRDEIGSHLEPLTDRKVKRVFLKHIQLITKLADNPHLTTLEKIQESFYLMEEWALEMLPMVNYETSIMDEDGKTLIISFDLNLLCRVNGLDIITPLQYLVDRISLAVDRAVNLLDDVNTESSMAMLELRVTAIKRAEHVVRTPVHEKFSEKLKDLDGWLSEVGDVEVRIKAYRELYREWYNELFNDMN